MRVRVSLSTLQLTSGSPYPFPSPQTPDPLYSPVTRRDNEPSRKEIKYSD